MGRSLKRQLGYIHGSISPLHGYGTVSSGRIFALAVVVLGVVYGVVGVIRGSFGAIPVISCSNEILIYFLQKIIQTLDIFPVKAPPPPVQALPLCACAIHPTPSIVSS